MIAVVRLLKFSMTVAPNSAPTRKIAPPSPAQCDVRHAAKIFCQRPAGARSQFASALLAALAALNTNADRNSPLLLAGIHPKVPQNRLGRARPGHPRLSCLGMKTRTPGSSQGRVPERSSQKWISL
jgi:hypothetical protein